MKNSVGGTPALQQFADDKLNGNAIAGSEERIFGIGPGLAYNQDNHQDKWWATLNEYFETGAENSSRELELS